MPKGYPNVLTVAWVIRILDLALKEGKYLSLREIARMINKSAGTISRGISYYLGMSWYEVVEELKNDGFRILILKLVMKDPGAFGIDVEEHRRRFCRPF